MESNNLTEQELIHSNIKNKYVSLPEEVKPSITLLLNVQVIMWLHGDLSFLKPDNPIVDYHKKKEKVSNGFTKGGKPKTINIKVNDDTRPIHKYKIGELLKECKKNEDEWCRRIMKDKCPKLPDGTQSKFGPMGEELCKEYYTLMSIESWKPVKKEGYSYTLDLETHDLMIESKSGSYHTGGTCGEKIMGVPFKYAEVPRLFGKPLKIVAIGDSEHYSNKLGLIGLSEISEKEQIKKCWNELSITYIGFTDLLKCV